MAFEQHRPRIKKLLSPSAPEIAAAKAAIVQKLSESEVADWQELKLAVYAVQGQQLIQDQQLRNLPPDDQAAYLKWEIAWRLGLASLQADGLVFPMTAMQAQQPLGLTITQQTSPSSSVSGSLTFEEFSVLLAQKYRIAPKGLEHDAKGFVLHDPDLYLMRINAEDMHARVASALREAVECYRLDLRIAACVLLGSASEGAWLELATTIAASGTLSIPSTLQKELDDGAPRAEIVQARTFDLVRSQCANQIKAANLSMPRWNGMNQIALLLRSLRNYSVHFGGDALEKLDYGSVGVLFLNGSEYFNDLYRLRNAF